MDRAEMKAEAPTVLFAMRSGKLLRLYRRHSGEGKDYFLYATPRNEDEFGFPLVSVMLPKNLFAEES